MPRVARIGLGYWELFTELSPCCLYLDKLINMLFPLKYFAGAQKDLIDYKLADGVARFGSFANEATLAVYGTARSQINAIDIDEENQNNTISDTEYKLSSQKLHKNRNGLRRAKIQKLETLLLSSNLRPILFRRKVERSRPKINLNSREVAINDLIHNPRNFRGIPR